MSFSEVAVIPEATNKALELSKFSEEATYAYVYIRVYLLCMRVLRWRNMCWKSVCYVIMTLCYGIYRDPDAVIQTSSNEAYGVTKTARARGGDAEYETVPAVPPSTSHSTQPPTDYEPV